MSVDTLIRQALDAGVELRFIGGKLKAVGRTDVLHVWAPRLREHREELIAALRTPEPATDWRELDRVYQQHHAKCAVCQSAGRGYGSRCGAGTALWSAYTQAATPTRESDA